MRHVAARVSWALVFVFAATIVHAQQSPRSAGNSVPRGMHVTGVFVPANGQKPASVETGTVGIYSEEQGGTPLWGETQQVAGESPRGFSIVVRAEKTGGPPLGLFSPPGGRR